MFLTSSFDPGMFRENLNTLIILNTLRLDWVKLQSNEIFTAKHRFSQLDIEHILSFIQIILDIIQFDVNFSFAGSIINQIKVLLYRTSPSNDGAHIDSRVLPTEVNSYLIRSKHDRTAGDLDFHRHFMRRQALYIHIEVIFEKSTYIVVESDFYLY